MSLSQSIHPFQSLKTLFQTPNSGYLSIQPHWSAPLASDAFSYIFTPAFDASLLGYALPTIRVLRVGNLWLPEETVPYLDRHTPSQSPLCIARNAVARGIEQMKESHLPQLTQHALMVGWGEFATEIGLIDKLSHIRIPVKGVVHAPQAKLLTLLMGILTGITHLKDLNEGPHPIAHDFWAIRAWGLYALPHYTGVSRTLAGCDEPTIADITEVLHSIADPFIETEIRSLLKQNQPLIVDFDIAPRRVSNTSTTFPEAEFGWQGNEVGLGYDAALVALTSPTYGRLFLAGFHYPRNPVGLPRLQQMVIATEARLRRRPKRRVELVEKRLENHKQQIAQRQQWLANQFAQQKTLWKQSQTLAETLAKLDEEIAELETLYRQTGRVETPHCKLAKARRRQQATGKKLMKVPKALQKAQRATATHQQQLIQLQAEETLLVKHLEQLRADNENHASWVPIILRMDAGFGTDANITWLIEMGYIIYTKAHNAKVANKLKGIVCPQTSFTRVGKNAEMIGFDGQFLNTCPYPLNMALERFHTPDGLKHSALIVYRDDDQTKTLQQWFHFYNSRQLIEAGIKEGNVVFKMHPLKMRSFGGIALQEQFSLFAANFVRFAAVWLKEKVNHSHTRFSKAFRRVKSMVRVMANTSAWVVATTKALCIRFDSTSAYPEAELRLQGTFLTRPPLLPKKSVSFSDFGNDSAFRCT